MHKHDDKYSSRPGFEPGTPRLQTPVDTNEPSVLATTLNNSNCHQLDVVSRYRDRDPQPQVGENY